MNKFENNMGNKFGPENIKLSELSEEQQVRAVEQGLKPLATSSTLFQTDLKILKTELPEVRLEIRNGRRIVVGKRMVPDYIYYKPENEFNAYRLKQLGEVYIQEEMRANIGDEVSAPPIGPEDEKHHREMGKLLGYTDEEVDDFLARIYK